MGRAFEVRKQSMAKTAAAKTKVYSKFGKELYMAAKGNPDPETNAALKSVIDRAKRAQVPKHVIDKAIDKAKGGSTENYKEKLFEGFGPGSSTVLVSTLSDNDNRVSSEVKNCFTKSESKIAVQNAVSFQYQNIALLAIKTSLNEDQLFEKLFEHECDVTSIELEDGIAELKAAPTEFSKIENFAKDIAETDEDIIVSEITYQANELVTLEGEELKRFNKLLDLLEEVDDVQEVYHNVQL